VFKQFWHKRAYRKDLQKSLERKDLGQKFKIKNINVILDASLPVDFHFFDEIAKILTVKKKAINVMTFMSTEHTQEEYSLVFDPKEVSFFGTFKGSLQTYCAQEVDLQINYFDTENLYMNWVASRTSSKLSVGFASVDRKINDIVFNFSPTDKELFKNELIKYLKILKRI